MIRKMIASFEWNAIFKDLKNSYKGQSQGYHSRKSNVII